MSTDKREVVLRALDNRYIEKRAFFGIGRVAGELATVPGMIRTHLAHGFHTGQAKHLIGSGNVRRFKVKRGGKEVWLPEGDLTKRERKRMRSNALQFRDKSAREEYVERKMRERSGEADPNAWEPKPGNQDGTKKKKGRWSDANIAASIGLGAAGVGSVGLGAAGYNKYKRSKEQEAE